MKIASFLSKSIGQIGIVVEDVDKFIKEHYEKFGIGDWQIYIYGSPLLSVMKYYGNPIEYKAKIALSYFGNTRIEVIQNLEGHTIYTDFINKHGYGVQHLGIYVPNMKSALEEATECGLKVAMEGGGFGLDGDGYFAYLDTEEIFGITYELIERPLRRHEPIYVYPSNI